MDSADEHSCALDNMASSTYVDASKLSDTLPSISIDENNGGEQDFFLKEHYDKIDRLRTENFDLKLKLYLLESNDKFTSESELKFKVIKEFDNKNQEIRNLKDTLKNQDKENAKLKRLLLEKDSKEHKHVQTENQQLKSKLSEALGICSSLVSHTENLVQMNRKLTAKDIDVDKLNKSVAFIGKASKFLADNSIDLLDLTGNIDSVPNGKKPNNRLDQNRGNIQTNVIPQDSSTSPVRIDSEKMTKLSQNEINSLKASQSEQNGHIDEFMREVESLRSLIEDFRSNKVTYKVFSTRLDSLVEELSEKYKILERMQLGRRQSDALLKTAEQKLIHEAALKERIKADLLKSMKKLDLIISKTKPSVY